MTDEELERLVQRRVNLDAQLWRYPDDDAIRKERNEVVRRIRDEQKRRLEHMND